LPRLQLTGTTSEDRNTNTSAAKSFDPLPHKESTMTAAGIISAIIIGLIIGALGRLVLPGRQNIPIWLTIVVGIGAAPASAIARGIGLADTPSIDSG
jgi:uncharacterized membrane protein YeaQ/YmgE (transglycosylase-associated protein family)